MAKKKQKNKRIVSCIIVVSVLFLSIGGYFAYPTLADMMLPKRHITNAFLNFGSRLQSSIDSLAETIDFLKVDGELEVYLDAFPKIKEKITVKDGSSDIAIRFGINGNKAYISANQLFENDISIELNPSDIYKWNQSDISSQLPAEYEQYREDCQKLDRILHEISKIDFQKHSDILSAASKDVAKGYASMLQDADCERLEHSDAELASYKIVCPQQLVQQKTDRVLDELYSDSKVLPYISILKSIAGIDKDSLKKGFAQLMEYIGDVDFVVDIDEKTDTIKNIYAYLIYNGKEACRLTLHF